MFNQIFSGFNPIFWVVLKGRNPHPSSLLKVPDIIVPAIFICLDVGTRKPESSS